LVREARARHRRRRLLGVGLVALAAEDPLFTGSQPRVLAYIPPGEVRDTTIEATQSLPPGTDRWPDVGLLEAFTFEASCIDRLRRPIPDALIETDLQQDIET
jgi:hypothetical protein